MTITFFLNYLNHHQAPVADELYHLLGDDFRFVATCPRDLSQLKGGIDYSLRPYCLLAAEDGFACDEAHRLNSESDVCVYGAGNLDWEKERAKTNKLSFEISERWFKRGVLNIFSPRLLKWWWLYQTKLRYRPFYKLCASAYTASDCRKLLTFKNRCFKWGYFTKLPTSFNRKQINHDEITNIIWCARLIKLKHPEMVIDLAERLQKAGYKFVVKLYGDGPLRKKISRMIENKRLTNCVFLMGKVANEEVQQAMADSEIFLFTSDRNEGWGAVVNEAMSNGCCVVGSNLIGSVPFLINDGENGLIYRRQNIDSLYKKVVYLIENPSRRNDMGRKAAKDLQEIWSPKVAAENFLQLVRDLQTGKTMSSILLGPCSRA